MDLSDPKLENRWVKLTPFEPSPEAFELVQNSGAVEAMWDWLPRVPGHGVTFEAYYDYVVSKIKTGEMVPVLATRKSDGAFIGGASYMRPSRTHRSVQIGYLWTTPTARGTNASLAIQAAMIERAIAWRAKRVYWVADIRNERLCRFLETRIGAVKEGEFECFARMNDGRWCDAAVYALVGDKLAAALPRIEALLETMD